MDLPILQNLNEDRLDPPNQGVVILAAAQAVYVLPLQTQLLYH